jgi:glycosyltransferase involved in cell wall biosynthesis
MSDQVLVPSGNTLRIAVDALPAFPGKSGAVGAFRSLLQIAPELDDSLELVYLVSSSQKAYYERFLDARFAERVVFRVFDFPESRRFCRLAAQNLVAPRVCHRVGVAVHFSLNPEPLFGMSGIREVFKVADLQFFDVPEEFGVWKVAYRKYVGRRKAIRSDLIIANSQYTKQRIIECFGITDQRIRVVYEAVDHGLFTPGGGASEAREGLIRKFGVNYPYIIYVSSFRPYKNHLHLLQAYRALMREHHIPHHLLLVGNDIGGYRRVVEETVGELGLTEWVHFVDYVHHWDLPDLYRAASLAVYPSSLETFGIPPLEAMACGTPVIVSCCAAVPEISGGGACVVDPHDVVAQAEAMLRVLNDRNYRHTLIEQGRAWCQQYTWRRNIGETLDLIKLLALGSDSR